MRTATIARKTNETEIALTLTLDGGREYENDTGCGFLNHMLDLFARHGGFGLQVRCQGDTDVDYHHTTEDTGIALGEAFAEALGDKRGINRYGNFLLPMDEALVLVAVDLCGRTTSCCDLSLPTQKVGDFDTELVAEFFLGFCRGAQATVHLKQLAGQYSHHIIEAAFKGFGRAMAQAAALDPARAGELPTTKGLL